MLKRLGAILATLALVASLAACAASNEAAPASPDGDVENIRECKTDTDCPRGEFCTPDGRCLSACEQDTDCTEGVCISGFCKDCRNDASCVILHPDAYCDLMYNTCKIGCEDCRTDQACIDDRCEPLSAIDGDTDAFDGDADSDSEGELEGEVVRCPEPPEGKLCEPGCFECVDRTKFKQCSENGMNLTTIFCGDEEICIPSFGKCQSYACNPEAPPSCDGQDVVNCKEDGSGVIRETCDAFSICRDGACVNVLCENEDILIFDMETRSRLASPDRFCNHVLNRGSATWGTDNGPRGVHMHFGSEPGAMRLDSSAGDFGENMSIILDVFIENQVAQSALILQKGDPLSYRLSYEEGRLVLSVRISGNEISLRSALVARMTWLNVAATFNGYSLVFYVNGSEATAPAVFENKKQIDRNESPIMFGASVAEDGVLGQPFAGAIDNLIMTDSALSKEEIDWLRAQTSPCSAFDSPEDADCSALCTRDVAVIDIDTEWSISEIEPKQMEAIFIDAGGCPRPHAAVSEGCSPISGDIRYSYENGEDGPACVDCPLPQTLRLSAIARFGAYGDAFSIAERGVFVAPKDTYVVFGYNDSVHAQNSGAYNVFVERGYCPSSDCPQGMLPIPGRHACIDRYEASCTDATAYQSPCNNGTVAAANSVPGKVPWTNITPESASVACATAGKRICTTDDWEDACGGIDQTHYPYGDQYAVSTCNDAKFSTPGVWETLLPTGYLSACHSSTGVLDLSGNAAEFAIIQGTYHYHAKAGKGMSLEQESSCRDYIETETATSTRGFRCCKDIH